jgi:hypothetical protein
MLPRPDRALASGFGLLLGMGIAISAEAPAPAAPLMLAAKIPLGEIIGRIDHLAVDVRRQRLFAAELGNNSLGVVDLGAGKALRTIGDLREPQGVGYEPVTDTIFIANAGDGSVRILHGDDLAETGRIELGEDADNVRVETAAHRVIVGYGGGAMAVIDPVSRMKSGDIRLPAHPEGFQIDGNRAFVNVPDAGLIEVVDLTKGGVIATWPTQANRANFPMAIDREAQRLFVVFRRPARLEIRSTVEGRVLANFETCGDADDVFVDARRRRIYVTCGAGAIDVFEDRSGGYQHISQIPTASGARTSLFVPEMDRLFVAVRAAGSEPAAIWVFRPG